jgi:hypothetical protein
VLTIVGEQSNPWCDGVSRRGFLKIGATGVGGLMLSDLLRLEAHAGTGSSRKALINIHLSGGPSHQDMWDLKPNAPAEIRGEFNPIPTNVSGMEICELFPKLSKMADRFALVRGMVGSVDEHSSSTSMTGYPESSLKVVGGRPSIGSVISKLSGESGTLPYVSLMGKVTPGYLGPTFQPYVPDGAARSNLKLEKIDAARLRSRTDLLAQLDTIRRDVDASGKMEALDTFTQKAVDMITSGKMAEALDTSKEKPETLTRYTGERQGRGRGHYDQNRNFLMARRLIEAGVRCVAMSWGGWDTHENNFKVLRDQLPALDTGLSALLDDLQDRRMLEDVTIVMWGEFGRSPRITDKGGRDHWARVSAAWLAGGGMRTGQVVGQSDRHASDALTPIHLHQVHATLYHNLGIDLKATQFVDPAGRPQYILDIQDPIRELV